MITYKMHWFIHILEPIIGLSKWIQGHCCNHNKISCANNRLKPIFITLYRFVWKIVSSRRSWFPSKHKRKYLTIIRAQTTHLKLRNYFRHFGTRWKEIRRTIMKLYRFNWKIFRYKFLTVNKTQIYIVISCRFRTPWCSRMRLIIQFGTCVLTS